MTWSIAVPARFAELTILREGEAGRAWLAGLPTLVDWLCETREWLMTQNARSGQSGGVVPERALARVREACTGLGPTAADVMVNADLHYENVVDGGDSWVVVDPKPVGDPEIALAPLLWRLEESGGQQTSTDGCVACSMAPVWTSIAPAAGSFYTRWTIGSGALRSGWPRIRCAARRSSIGC